MEDRHIIKHHSNNKTEKNILEIEVVNQEDKNNVQKEKKVKSFVQSIEETYKIQTFENFYWLVVCYNCVTNYINSTLKCPYNYNNYEAKLCFFKEISKQDQELNLFIQPSINERFENLKLNTSFQAASSQGASKLWVIHKKFAELYTKYGKSFKYFVADLIDFILGCYHKNQVIQEIFKSIYKKKDKLEIKKDISIIFETTEGIKIGNEPVVLVQNFIKQKLLLASIIVDISFHDEFEYLYQELNRICKEQVNSENGCINDFLDKSSKVESNTENNLLDVYNKIKQIVETLPGEINQLKIAQIWILLDLCDFEYLEYIFSETKNWSIVRPNFYEELDKAYRETKKLLKLLIKEFENESEFIENIKSSLISAKKKVCIIKDYLEDILMVYTHHHFVVKHFHKFKPNITKSELVEQTLQWRARIENLLKDNSRLRNELQKVIFERDSAYSEIRKLKNENQQLLSNMQRLEPEQVKKNLKALECKINQLSKEKQLILEENMELYTQIRKLEAENKELAQKLRDMKALPQENEKSVAGLLDGKRVVIFGGVSRDHYKAVLEEAGVKDEDYEWYEGYHTISLARSAEIVKRCDVVVVITSYAGHLHTWQTRSVIQPHQTLLLIHSSGAGSLRNQLIEKFKKNE